MDLFRRQARLYKLAQKSIWRRIKHGERVDPEYDIPEDIRKEMSEINVFLSRAANGLIVVREAVADTTGGLTTEQLNAQLRQELIMAARTFTVEEWRVLDEVRAQCAAGLVVS